MNTAYGDVHMLLLIGIQVESISPAKREYRARKEQPASLFGGSPRQSQNCPAKIPNRTFVIAGSVLTKPSGSQVLVRLYMWPREQHSVDPFLEIAVDSEAARPTSRYRNRLHQNPIGR